MSWEQGQMWRAYDTVEPFGEQRADLRSGIIAATVRNTIMQVNSAKRIPRSQLAKPTDYILTPDPAEREQRSERQRATQDPHAWNSWLGDMKQRVANKFGRK